MSDLWHSWGDSPKQKAREKEYNHWYYEKFKDAILKKRKKITDLVETPYHDRANFDDGGSYKFDRYSIKTGTKDSFGYDNSIGIERHKVTSPSHGTRANTVALRYYNLDWSDPNGETKKIKVGPVTLERVDDGGSITLDLDYGNKKLTALGQSVINTGKSIIDKLKGGR